MKEYKCLNCDLHFIIKNTTEIIKYCPKCMCKDFRYWTVKEIEDDL